ncbi:catalase [Idiomarina fontislapidosi]|uniref:Catalase-related peroxidase n=1 Tax=Idiomarina fontislapidosi TaxID=263723 RepID=A0A432Y937_9GAMM|nr:catalase family peroxidase [Idiomarina fontislapidosi]PYE34627.1 catalase [Idiomarina fontislapidosi]RUO57421.1 catalase [Idiomarina fontislapidosi]
MQTKTIFIALLSLAAPTAVAQQAITQAPTSATANDFIEVFQQLSGEHPGIRKGHAKGVCAAGTFQPSATAQARFDTPLFSEDTAITVRFSMGGGNPNANEAANAPRGMAVLFDLPNSNQHKIAGLTTPMFAGKNPEQFLGLLRINYAIAQGEATAADRETYFKNNPEAAHQGEWLQNHQPAAEYTSANYFGIHTFYTTLTNGELQAFRWTLVPQAGEVLLTEQEQQKLPHSFLAKRLSDRISQGAVTYEWHWHLAESGDPLNDPSQVWPKDRETVNVGTLTLAEAGGEACTPINFDPNQVTDGISASQDPVLQIRSPAYAISFGKRLQKQ